MCYIVLLPWFATIVVLSDHVGGDHISHVIVLFGCLAQNTLISNCSMYVVATYHLPTMRMPFHHQCQLSPNQ